MKWWRSSEYSGRICMIYGSCLMNFHHHQHILPKHCIQFIHLLSHCIKLLCCRNSSLVQMFLVSLASVYLGPECGSIDSSIGTSVQRKWIDHCDVVVFKGMHMLISCPLKRIYTSRADCFFWLLLHAFCFHADVTLKSGILLRTGYGVFYCVPNWRRLICGSVEMQERALSNSNTLDNWVS